MAGKWGRRLGWTLAVVLVGGGALWTQIGEQAKLDLTQGQGGTPQIPAVAQTLIPTINVAKVVGWSGNATPIAAAGLRVTAYATGLDHPRWLYRLPNGDVLVAESSGPAVSTDNDGAMGVATKFVMGRAGAMVQSAERITLLRDSDGDGVVDLHTVFLTGLRSPIGMALVGTDFYVANADAVMKFAYTPGATSITKPGTKLVDLPGGPRNHHWTKNILASADGKTLYASVGSNSNVGDNGLAEEKDRAAIWAIDLSTGKHRLFATGLRNPVGMGWQPETGQLWTSVNERDEIGSDLVPDYMTSVRDGGFYGWPYSYWGGHVDTRVSPQRPDLVARAIAPDYALGPHTASLGLTFDTGSALPTAYRGGAFIGQHGSWNRNPVSGYKVVFVRFAAGKAIGLPVDVLTGFLNTKGEAQGRPVGVTFDAGGALLVADDVGNRVWRVSAK